MNQRSLQGSRHVVRPQDGQSEGDVRVCKECS